MVTLTEAAAAKVKELLGDKSNDGNNCLRIYVQGGGCSGFSYGIVLDQKQEGDQEYLSQGVQVVVDAMSLRHLDGCEIDFKSDDLLNVGFVVKNPNAQSTCGCGHSFSSDPAEK